MRPHAAERVERSFLPPALLPAAFILFILAGTGPNTLLALAAVLVLVVGSALVWRPGESPILLFILALQWLQACVAIFHANLFGLSVNELTALGGDSQTAIILSLVGLFMLCLGMRAGAGPWRPQDGQLARMTAMRLPPARLARLYAMAWAVATMGEGSAWVIPGLSQPLLALGQVKWAFFFLLTYATFSRPGASKFYWLIAFAVEFALSIGGFFSDFKSVFFFSAFGLLAAGVRFSIGQLVGLTTMASMFVAAMIVWTAIKPEYRSFVSGGESNQTVNVDYWTGMDKLGTLIGELDHVKLENATDHFLRRLTYTDFFGLVLQYVPSVRDHEYGALWIDAVSRPFMPRILFPWKTAIHDSERTALYTGRHVTGADQGTSISLGYMAETYIDFGQYAMMLAILVYGYVLGRIYRWLLTNRHSRGFFGMGLASAVLFGAGFFESSITKVFGGIIVKLLVAIMLIYVVAPRYLPWLRAPERSPPVR